jgi:hypothetical protein
MINEERIKGLESIESVLNLYDNGAKGLSVWCSFAQGSHKLRRRWLFRTIKAACFIVFFGVLYYLFS